MEVDKVCRICLNSSDDLKPIFGYEIDDVPIHFVMKKVLWSSLLIPNEKDEALPKNLCLECVDVLTQSYRLNELCTSTEIQLQAVINENCSKVFIKEELKPDLDDSVKAIESRNIEVKEEVFTVTLEPIEESIYESQEDLTFDENDESHESSEDMEEETPKKNTRKVVKRHECPTCLKLFEKPSKLARHIKTHDVNKKPFACEHPGCYHRFLTDASLKRHRILHSGMTIKVKEDKTYECIICLKEFQVQESLASHMRTHKDVMEQMEFPCNLCDQVFKKLNELTRHRRKHPENKAHKCLICSKMFSQGSHLIDHLNRHNNLRPHECNVCRKTFQQSSTLKDHLRTHSNDKPFLCSECGKSFNNPSNLRQHVKRHTNSKEFVCHLCPGKFSCKASLDSHIRSHSGLRPHSCEICGSSFTKGSSLKKHIRTIHEGIKPFECEACLMRFNSGEHLKRHFRTHTGEKPYKCEFEGCDRAYAQSNDLLKHKKIHIGELVYKCTICTDAFRLQSQLRDHYKVHYKNDESASQTKSKDIKIKSKELKK